MVYEHTQRSLLWVLVGLPMLVGVGFAGASSGGSTSVSIVVVAAVVVMIAVLAHFSSLTVTVDADSARAAFGLGWPNKTVRFAEVAYARPARNRWWYGFGIRVIPKGTLWNVWGLDAVEFVLGNGRVVRFGTDDPDGLLAALIGRVGAG
jgi:hypothetical protein